MSAQRRDEVSPVRGRRRRGDDARCSSPTGTPWRQGSSRRSCGRCRRPMAGCSTTRSELRGEGEQSATWSSRRRRGRAGRTAKALRRPAVAAREVRLPRLVLRLGDRLVVDVPIVLEDLGRREGHAGPRHGIGRAAVRATLRDVVRVSTVTARRKRARGQKEEEGEREDAPS